MIPARPAHEHHDGRRRRGRSRRAMGMFLFRMLLLFALYTLTIGLLPALRPRRAG